MKPSRCLLFAFLQIACFSALSQKQQIRFDHMGTDQGLSQSNVICILQDSRGFMWFGTREGLNKYDGYKFTVYKNDSRDPHSLRNNYIRSIIESRDGNIWIATSGGLCMFDRMKNRFVNFIHDPKNKFSIANDVVLSVMEDYLGNIWAGTESGLNLLDRKTSQFKLYTHKKNDTTSLDEMRIKNIFEDSQHTLWICTTGGGLSRFNTTTKTFTRFQHNKKDNRSISSNAVNTMFEDSKHRLWVGTNDGGLELFNKQSGEFFHFKHDDNNKNSLAANSVFAINEDNDNNLWIGTENGGLSIFNPETNTFYTYQNEVVDNTSLINNSIYSICKDTKGNIWLGTFNGGVDMVNPDSRKFTHYKHIVNKNSLSNNNVLCIYEDSHENIWIGTDGGGLNLFDPQTGHFTHFGHEKNNNNSISGHYVLTVCEDSEGNIWVGTWADGITVINRKKGTFTHYKNDPNDPASLGSNNVWKIYEDKDQNMWIGTYGGGLNLFNPVNNSFTRYQHEENNKASISNNNTHSILEDSEGKLWITTDGGGLNLFDKKTKTFSHLLHDDKKNSIINNSAGSMYEDRNKNLWIATMAGLSFLDKKTGRFINYTTHDGLPNNVIFGILEDQKGNLWISTSKGISRFDPVNKIFKNFGVSDGLQANEFKQQAYCKSSNGTMYFGGNNGFNQFFPDSIKTVAFTPPLVITGFQIFNKEVPVSVDSTISPLLKDITDTREITVSYKSSVISFEFASLNYTIPEKKQYAYMLEGFDEKWNEIGTRRTATYTNLNPGNYTFRVRGLNNDGNWSDAVASLQLTITPPFWISWWFRTLCILFILGCFVVFYRMRMKTITNKKVQLEKQVKERTDEIMLQKEELSRNVEELAALEEDLQKEKYYLDSLMDNMPDAIYFKDRESRFLRVSTYMVKKHLASRPEATINDLLGKTDFDLQDERHAKEAYKDEQEIQKTRIPKIDYIEKETTEDGSDRWVATTKLPLLNRHDEVVGTFGISRDVTKIKLLESQKHEAVMDKAVAQGKFEIASEVMHDIGNAISGFGSHLTRIKRMQETGNMKNLENLITFFEEQKKIMADAIGEPKADAVIKMLSGIVQTQQDNEHETIKSVTQQLNIVSNIEEILNIQRKYISGYESKDRKTVNIKNIIDDSLSMLFSFISKNNIDVSLNIANDLPPIKGDRTKLMQLLLNLIKNSMEATAENQHEKNICIDVFTDMDKLILRVMDNGKGFDATIANQLFIRGFSTKHNRQSQSLYNCKTIVESHEGTIDIISKGPGKGSLTTVGFRILAA